MYIFISEGACEEREEERQGRELEEEVEEAEEKVGLYIFIC
jgi:hypothetical protein